MKIYLIFFALLANVFPSGAQNLSAYTDYKNFFYAFDNGPNILLESQPVVSYKVGRSAIPYVNGAGSFKAYYQGDIYDLLSIAPANYIAAGNYVAYYRDMALWVFDKGKRTMVSGYCKSYMAGDSMLGFYDLNSHMLKVYYNEQVVELENIYGQEDSTNFKVGDNILAYVNNAGQFKIFYKEQTIVLEGSEPTNYQVGKNIVAYVDGYTQAFKIFYKGMSYTVESIPAASYVAADDMVAYVTASGDFKIFFQGQLLKASTIAPVFYQAKDNVLLFYDNRYFTAFYNGKITTLETYVPSSYQKDLNTIAYIDRNGYLQALYNGKKQKISQEKVNMFELTGNVLKYNSGISDFRFFVNGKTVLH